MIELKGISRIYRLGGEVQALKNVSLKIEQAEFIAIMGPSGSGKSTLLHILGFLDRPDSGTYKLNQSEITKLSDDELAILRNRLVGFVFQQFHLLSRVTALENTELPLIYGGKRHLREKALHELEEVGLGQRVTHRPNELSGGEQQRVAIARSLVNEPLIILADEPTGNLDSKSEEEIISILEKLNQKGKTIVMVTHEKEIAEHAKRIIRMRDGEIISDEKRDNGSKRVSPASADIGLENLFSQYNFAKGRAEFIDHFRQAVYAITSHKMRSFLSMLGILIGVAAVIAMLALGRGAKESIEERLVSLGTNLLMVMPGSRQLQGVALGAGVVTRITLQDAEAISKLPEVKMVSPSINGRAQLVYGNKNWNTQVLGTGADYAVMRSSIPASGRFFSEEEVREREKIVLLGVKVAGELFGDTSPLGGIIKINRINFRVIGILPEKGATGWHDQDDLVIIPVTTAMYRLFGRKYVNSIDVEIKNPDLIEKAQETIRNCVIRQQHIKNENENSIQIRNMAEIQEAMESTTKTMTWLLGSIAGISLLVGGIGIMNIMLVSVTERTREIGLRKAIGARRRDIMNQFIIESIMMTLIGGIVGIVFGLSIAWLLTKLFGWTTSVTIFSILLATIFSISVGMGFGLWPAKKASQLNPIEALRYE